MRGELPLTPLGLGERTLRRPLGFGDFLAAGTCLCGRLRISNWARRAKITQFDMAAAIEEYICRLDVPVHEARRVHRVDGAE